MALEVFMAMSCEQAKRENGFPCMEPELPKSGGIYMSMGEIPEDRCLFREIGWRKEIHITKEYFLELARQWYPEGSEYDFRELFGENGIYRKLLNRIEGDTICLIGFGG